MDKNIERAAAKLGYTSLREGQAAVIEAVMAGRDVLGILPTGSGKTLCYQLPGLVRPGVTIVIEPLLALMRDQLLRLQAMGIKHVAMLSSMQTADEQRTVLAQLGKFKFVFMAPEMLGRDDVQYAIKRAAVQMVVVDEAHCIYQWGPDFRPDYLQLSRVRQIAPEAQLLALTATAPVVVREVIVNTLTMNQAFIYNGGADRPNLFIGRMMVDNLSAQYDEMERCLRHVTGRAIVYCRTKHDCEQLAERFAGVNQRQTAFYHAGLDAHTRLLRERQFQQGDLDTLFATSAFGMGVDQADVRLVIYLGVPATLEDYLQAIGRAGRDGLFALTLLLYTQHDVQQTSGWVGSLPTTSLIQAIYRDTTAYYGSDDPQIQLVLAYARSGYTAEQVSHALDRRAATKARDFTAVEQFLAASGCLRQELMTHFDSSAKAHDEVCCGALSSDIFRQLPKIKSTLPADSGDWRSVFARIFNYGTSSTPRM